MKTILVTGGAGFIGSHLCEKYLADGHRVICIDNLQTMHSTQNIDHLFANKNFAFIQHDIIDPLTLPNEKIDWIFQFACSGSPAIYQHDPVHTWKTSTIGSLNMLELARAHKARVLFASTSEVYGDPKVHPQPETYTGNVHTTGPRACYDEGKRAAESLHVDYGREFGVDVKIIRIFNTYGPRMNPNEGRAITDFIGDAVGGRSIKSSGKELVIYGDGTPKRSFQYIDDLLRGIDLMMNKDGFVGPVNLGNPGEITMYELAEKIIALSGSDVKIVCENKHPTNDPSRRLPDISLARTELNWQPQVSLDEGLLKTIEWFKHQKRPDTSILVFATTFYPTLGPAEKVLFDVIQKTPDTEFHVVTSRMERHLPKEQRIGNLYIYRVGFGLKLDKYILPVLGYFRALPLQHQKGFEFIWSIMASYGGLAALLLARSNKKLNLFVSLDTSEFNGSTSFSRLARGFLSRAIFARADATFISDPSQESEFKRLYPSLESGLVRNSQTEEFMLQMKKTYIETYNTKRGTLRRPK